MESLNLPTIDFEVALERELEYRKRLNLAQSQQTVASALTQLTNPRDTYQSQISNSRYQGFTPQTPRTFAIPQPLTTTDQKPPPPAAAPPPLPPPPKRQNHIRQRRKPPRMQILHSVPPYVQLRRPAQPVSYWCKLCKIDCTTEQNFSAHIGGKKHQAKKLEILGNGNRNQNQNRNENQNGSGVGLEEASGSGSKKDPEGSIENVILIAD